DMRRNENPHNASLHHQGGANSMLAMETTVEPSASQPATAKAAATRQGLAETAIPEVVGALPTRTPGIEVLLALRPLHASLVILGELGEVRRGCRGAWAPQLPPATGPPGGFAAPQPQTPPEGSVPAGAAGTGSGSRRRSAIAPTRWWCACIYCRLS